MLLSSKLIAANAEQEDNVAEQKRQLGKKVLYGEVIQLKHAFTCKYIHVSTTQTSHTESSNIQARANLPYSCHQ
ncbi:hypothetical protein LSAT2_003195 [Lamellibrachia satsuma]|nr:hypothetical protein LSAT2_003195 [Lamellibrachia satsuma]